MFAPAAQAAEFCLADTRSADDYPAVAAVEYMNGLFDKKSRGKYKLMVFNKGNSAAEGSYRQGQNRHARLYTHQRRPDERRLPDNGGL